MGALEPEVVDVLWRTLEPLLPAPEVSHPLGCHRPRVPDRLCFRGILIRLVTGASWVDIEAILDRQVSDTTLRARRDAWIDAGVFEQLKAEALAGYDRIVGLDLDDVALNGSLHKAPYGGEGTGPNPTDRGKLGWKCAPGGRWRHEGPRREEAADPARAPLDRRGHRLPVVELRAAPPQHRPPHRHRHAALCLATTVLIIGRLLNWRDRWSPR
jgi:transposase